jgi:hypothetical protein
MWPGEEHVSCSDVQCFMHNRVVPLAWWVKRANPEAVKDVVAKFNALLESIESADLHVHRSAKNANACFIDTRTWEGDILGRTMEARAALAKLKGEK